MKIAYWLILIIAFCLITVLFPGSHSQVFAQGNSFISIRAIDIRPFRPVCGSLVKDNMRCLSHVATDNSGRPLSGPAPFASSYGPAQFHGAYNLPCSPGGLVGAACSGSSFGKQTIAIVDAYNDRSLQSDLNVYDTYYKLPACTSGCLAIVNQNGKSSPLPSSNSGWALEESLDVQTAHMICQTCKILVVEANSSAYANLAAAVNTAAGLGATEISNSYGGPEWSSEKSFDSYYTHPGIAITASAGDSGYGAMYPAASAGVVAVGGTTLQVASGTSAWANETVWPDSGSGCSQYETASGWQTILPLVWPLTKCGSSRAIADVSADADPDTGAAVYDSTSYEGYTGWFQVGGTSLSSPIIAGVYALAGGVASNSAASSLIYAHIAAITGSLHEITSGSNGSCSSIMCKGEPGAYDGPGGFGSPNGTQAF